MEGEKRKFDDRPQIMTFDEPTHQKSTNASKQQSARARIHICSFVLGVGAGKKTTYVLDAVVGVVGRQQESADRGDVQVLLAIVLEADQHLDTLAGSELCE